MKKESKYPIHPDFKKWENFHPPLGGPSLYFLKSIVSWSYYAPKTDDEFVIERFNIPLGSKGMKAMLITPKTAVAPAPCLLYLHGGGFIMPASRAHYANAKTYAKAANCKVLMVEYPLSPKHKHPEHLDGCFRAYEWLLSMASALGVNTQKIAVGGDSAGGALSVATCLKIRDNNLVKPCGLMLVYPLVFLKEDTPSMLKFTDTPMCNSSDFDKYRKLCFPENANEDDKFVLFYYEKNLDFCPQAYVETAEFDCLHDGAVMFADKLKSAGISVCVHNTLGTIHGYDIVLESPITQESLKKRCEFLKKCFE